MSPSLTAAVGCSLWQPFPQPATPLSSAHVAVQQTTSVLARVLQTTIMADTGPAGHGKGERSWDRALDLWKDIHMAECEYACICKVTLI